MSINGNFNIIKYSLKSVMDNMENGEYVIPPYQRDYVWKPDQIASLMESISKKYPIGVITITDSKSSSFKDGKNEIMEIVSSENTAKNWIVVDGQQRLTSLTIIYFANEISLRAKELNEKNRKFITKTFNNTLFYEGKFYEAKQLKKELEDEQLQSNEIKKIISESSVCHKEVNLKVRKILDEFPIWFLKLSDWKTEEVIKIFTAMNKGTRALTHVDLMNGSMFNASASHNKEFDLLKYIKSVNDKIKNIGSIKPEYMVQLIKIYYDIVWENGNVKYSKKELLEFSMNPAQVNMFVQNLNQFEEFIFKTFSILDTKFDIYTFDHLPKNVYFSVIFSLVCRYKKDDKDIPLSILKRAVSLITKRLIDGEYASSPGVKTLEDINSMILKMQINEFVNHETKEGRKDIENYKKKILEKFRELSYKNKNNALFKLAFSVLASNQPRMLFEKETYVPVKPSSVTSQDIDLHHFIPKNSKFAIEKEIPIHILNSIGNIVLITSDENRNKIRNKNLDIYLMESKNNLGIENFDNMLSSHFINQEYLKKILYLKSDTDLTKVFSSVTKLFDTRTEEISNRVFKKFLDIN